MRTPARPVAARRSVLAVAIALLAVAGCAARAGGSARAPGIEVWAFAAYWDERSALSVRQHRASLDAIVETWLALDSTSGALRVEHRAPAGSGRTFALVTSWHGDRFHPDVVRALAGDSARLARTADAAAAAAKAAGDRGMVLDFEAHVPADRPLLLRAVRAFARAARIHGVRPLSIAIPATDTVAYPAAALVEAGADFVMPMLYDLHWTGGDAGPVVTEAWAAQWLAVRIAEVGADRVVTGLPVYGYAWSAPKRGATVGWDEAASAVERAGGRLRRDAASGALRARLRDGGDLWITDAVQLERLLAMSRRAGVRRVALWRLGQEDPAIWRTIADARR